MKSKVVKTRKKSTQRRIWPLIVLILILPIIVIAAQFRQNIFSSAQMALQGPPSFFCLQFGESDDKQCASQSFNGSTKLQVNGFELTRDKIVYYNDTVSGTATYTNTGDHPLQIKTITLAATAKSGNTRVDFTPPTQNQSVQPGQTIGIDTTSTTFKSPQPGGTWDVFSTLTTEDGQRVNNSSKTIISVSTACTALRAIPLSESDKSNLKSYCGSNANSKLCTSRQYCELIKGEGCNQKAPQQDYMDHNLQCDEFIVLPKEEEDMLGEFCKVYPNATTCRDFCLRAIESPNCPDPNVVEGGDTLGFSVVPKAEAAAACASGTFGIINGVPNQCCRTTVKNRNSNECCKYSGPLLATGQCPRAPGGSGAAPATGGGNSSTCKSGTANKIGQCCKYSGPLRSTGQCPTAPGGGGGGGAPAAPSCASGTRNKIGQCCKYKGPLRSTGQCPTAAGGGGPAQRVIGSRGGALARVCAAGSTRNASGVCVKSGGTPVIPGGRDAFACLGTCRKPFDAAYDRCLAGCTPSNPQCKNVCTGELNNRVDDCRVKCNVP